MNILKHEFVTVIDEQTKEPIYFLSLSIPVKDMVQALKILKAINEWDIVPKVKPKPKGKTEEIIHDNPKEEEEIAAPEINL